MIDPSLSGPHLTPDPEPGWRALSAPFIDRGPVFVSGDPTGERIRVHYFQREADSALTGKVWFGPGAEGPPGNAHGGGVAAVLDEAMGYAAWVREIPVVAAKITIEFRQMLPLDTWVILEAWIERRSGRKVKTRAHLLGANGKPFAQAHGLFIALPPDQFHRLREAREARERGEASA